jgi:hypothetical protein
MTIKLRMLIGAVSVSVTLHCADAASIYRCKTYSGGNYWSQNACGKSGGVMVDMLHVPDGMSFAEQSKMADQIYKDRQQKESTADSDRERSKQCAGIDRELDEIWSNYKNGQYVPPEKVGAHQTRTRELKSLRTKLGCQSK